MPCSGLALSVLVVRDTGDHVASSAVSARRAESR